MHRRPAESVVTQDQSKNNEVQTASKEPPNFVRPDSGQKPTQESSDGMLARVKRWCLKLWSPTKQQPIVKGHSRGWYFGSWYGRVSDALERWFGKRRPVVDEAADQEIWFRAGSSLMALEVRSAPTGWNAAAATKYVVVEDLQAGWVQTFPGPGLLQPYSGNLAHQSNLASGEHQHYFTNATSTLSVGTGDKLFAYVYLDPDSPPSEVMLQWNDGSWDHRAYWGSNDITFGTDGTNSRRYMGSLPTTGEWVRLEVDASLVGLEGQTLTGMAFTLYNGRATWDKAGVKSGGVDTAWVEDSTPAGATLASDGGDSWNWIPVSPAPLPYSGNLAHQSNVASGEHQHYFYNATSTVSVGTGDKLFAYVYLDPTNPPTEVMLQWNDGDWDHRAYWGANSINWGTNGTDSRRFMGSLPSTGGWVRLEVDASLVGLEGHTLNGMAFTLYDGRATWDYAGTHSGGIDTAWVEDSTPAGATLASDGGDSWNWTSGTFVLPDGRWGYVVDASSGVLILSQNGSMQYATGTGSVTLNSLNNSTTATITYDDGAGHSDTVNTALSQFHVTYSGTAGQIAFDTFCIDLTHRVTVNQTYDVEVRTDLVSSFPVGAPFTNGSRMAYIFDRYGTQNLSGNSVQAAAVQLALWDLSLNHNPLFFGFDGDSYNSGDPGMFDVQLSGSDAAAIAALTNQYLQDSFFATTAGAWLDASINGDSLNRGQSLILPEPLRIFRNYQATSVSIEATTPDAYEVGEVPGEFTVTRTGDLSQALVVNYTVTGSAAPGDDYTTLTGTVTIAANQSQTTIPVEPPFQDNTPEVDELVIVSLAPGNYAIGTPGSDIVTIHDTTVSIEAIDNTVEGSSSPGRFTISRNGPAIGDLFVSYGISGGTALPGFDYDYIPGFVIIPDGDNSVDVLIDAIDDADFESTETVELTLLQDPLYAINPALASATITIDDDDTTDQWPMDAFILNWDPLTGQGVQQTGDNQVSYALDLDRSPGIVQGGNSYLVYNSDFVDARPIVQATLVSDASQPLPTQIKAELTFNGVPQAAKMFSTSGLVAGAPFTIAVQVDDPVTATNRYAWSLTVTMDYPGTSNDIVRTTSNETNFVVVQDVDNAYGAGWSFSMVDRLYDIDSTNGPAGKLRVYGTGSWRFYEDNGNGTFTSEPGDNGTLTAVSGGFEYKTPDGQKWTFNSDGMQTAWTSADGQETLAFNYIDADSDTETDDLDSMTSIDGGSDSFSYTSGLLSGISGAVRSYTIGHGSNENLTTIATSGLGTQTYTYDTDADWVHHLVKEQIGQYFTDYAYTSGALTSSSRGGLYDMDYAPAALVGMTDPEMGELQGSTSDAAMESIWTMDERGRPLTYRDTSTGSALTIWNRDSTTYVQSMTDAAGLTTTYTRDADGDITQEELADGSFRAYVYDSFGGNKRLKNTIDENGNVTTMLYDSAGHLTTYTNALNQTTVNAYASTGLLLSTTDANGHVTSFGYDSFRRKTQVIEAFGTGIARTATTTYDAGEVFNVIDPLGRVTSYGYDSAKHLTQLVEALGTADERRMTYAYDAAGIMTNAIDALGRITSYAYDAARRQTERIDAFRTGFARSFETSYDTANRVSDERDALGRITHYDYNVAQRMQARTDAFGTPEQASTVTHSNVVGNTQYTVDALAHVSRQFYDSRHRVTTMIQAQGSAAQVVSVHQYDGVGNVTTMTNARAYDTVYHYDALNRQIEVEDALGNETTTVYDAVGNVLGTVDPLGHRTTYGYDALNRQITVEDPLGHVTTTVYDAANNVRSVTDARGYTTTSTYDSLNRRVAFEDALTNITTTVYDDAGNVTTSIDARGNVTEYFYDPLNRQLKVEDALGNVTMTVRDAVGNVIATLDQLANLTGYKYDALNRQLSVRKPSGAIATTTYDTAGNVVNTIDAVGNVTTFVYDALDRRIGTIDARSGITTNFYDENGNLVNLIDPVGNASTFVFDEIDRQTNEIDPFGKTITVTYDAAGRVETRIDRLGRKMEYDYDDDNRLLEVTWRDAANSIVNLLTYTYDANDNQLTARDADGTVTFTYDELNRVKTQKDVWNKMLTYTYDQVGNRTVVADSEGGLTTSTFDALNRLDQRTFTGSSVTLMVDVDYTARSEVKSEIRYSDLTATNKVASTSYTYDPAGRLTSLHHRDGANNTIGDYGYTYDIADRVTSETLNGMTKDYSYDETNQLTNDTDAAYSYDLAGNRNMSGYATDAANRITNDGIFTYTYDFEGNLTKRSKGASAETWTFAYDNANQLVGVEKRATDGGALQMAATYVYDALGNRIEKQVWNGSTTRFTFDRGLILFELNGSGSLTSRFILGDDMLQRFARVASTGVAWLLADRLGSIRQVVNASGSLLSRLEYTGFGLIDIETSPATSGNHLYAGYYFDRETGLYVPDLSKWGRIYNPETSQWLQEDPSRLSGLDYNFRRYVSNNATNLADIEGLQQSNLNRTNPYRGNLYEPPHMYIPPTPRKREPDYWADFIYPPAEARLHTPDPQGDVLRVDPLFARFVHLIRKPAQWLPDDNGRKVYGITNQEIDVRFKTVQSSNGMWSVTTEEKDVPRVFATVRIRTEVEGRAIPRELRGVIAAHEDKHVYAGYQWVMRNQIAIVNDYHTPPRFQTEDDALDYVRELGAKWQKRLDIALKNDTDHDTPDWRNYLIRQRTYLKKLETKLSFILPN